MTCGIALQTTSNIIVFLKFVSYSYFLAWKLSLILHIAVSVNGRFIVVTKTYIFCIFFVLAKKMVKHVKCFQILFLEICATSVDVVDVSKVLNVQFVVLLLLSLVNQFTCYFGCVAVHNFNYILNFLILK